MLMFFCCVHTGGRETDIRKAELERTQEEPPGDGREKHWVAQQETEPAAAVNRAHGAEVPSEGISPTDCEISALCPMCKDQFLANNL